MKVHGNAYRTDEALISVVMGVSNGADCLAETMESVLSQQSVQLEFVVVNDGSTDGTAGLLNRYAARDSRVRVIHGPDNRGLTRALRQGCALATGRFIARQDCGDRSLENRLARQALALEENPQWVMVGGAASSCTEGEVVMKRIMTSSELRLGLQCNSVSSVFGPPHHGAVMFRRDAYERVGGYRREFYFAQDLDLWLRLLEIGEVGCLEDVMYQAALAPHSISGRYRAQQERLKELALQCRMARQRDESEEPYLHQAEMIRPERGPYDQSTGHYFIGRLLEPLNRHKALHYYREALSRNPGNWKARMRSLYLRIKMAIS